MTVTYRIERFAEFRGDILALVGDHWQEVGSFQDEFQHRINYDHYAAMDEQGVMLNVTARDDGRLVGYVLSVMGEDFHRMTWDDPPVYLKMLSGVVYYMVPKYRGYARNLFRLLEREAEARGVSIINQRAKPGLNRADAFFRLMGYAPMEVTHTKLIGTAARVLPGSTEPSKRG